MMTRQPEEQSTRQRSGATTIAGALNVANRSVSFREAEIFLGYVLDVERSYLHAHAERVLTAEELASYEECLRRRETNEPVAYITGVKEFYGRPFKCDARALIPRPETEGIIDLAKAFAPKYFAKHTAETNKPCPVRILELGTGVGNIAVTLAAELTIPAQILATDVVEEALELAAENLAALAPSSQVKTSFIVAGLFQHPEIEKWAPFPLILANLPYVPSTWQFNPLAQAEVVFREPEVALFSGEDGLDLYRQFFAQAATFLAEDGLLVVEHNEDQGDLIQALARKAFPEKTITQHQDYAGLDRILEIKNS